MVRRLRAKAVERGRAADSNLSTLQARRRPRKRLRRVSFHDTPAKKSADCLSELEKILLPMLTLGPDEPGEGVPQPVAVVDKVKIDR